MSSKYERELKGIFEGDKERIKKMTKTVSDDVREIYEMCVDNPFMVVRGAGSLGIDLVVLKEGIGFTLEVKSNKNDKIYIGNSGRLYEQYVVFREQAEKSQTPTGYAFRRKSGGHGERWSICDIGNGMLNNIVSDGVEIPSMPKTVHGNRYMSYDDGMLLSRFIELLMEELL